MKVLIDTKEVWLDTMEFWSDNLEVCSDDIKVWSDPMEVWCDLKHRELKIDNSTYSFQTISFRKICIKN